MASAPISRRLLAGVLAWCALALVAMAVGGTYRFVHLRTEFDAEAGATYRVISQRVDQHDAHLTSLAAILASPERSIATLRAVAEAVLRFYPRIAAIDVVSLDGAPNVTFTTRELDSAPRPVERIAEIAGGLQPGQAVIAAEGSTGEYDLVKRLPAGAIVMTIDGRKLSEPDSGAHSAGQLVLSGPSGREIARSGALAEAGGLLPSFIFVKDVQSRSQPLRLEISRHPALSEVLPTLMVLLIALLGGLVTLLGMLALRERRTAAEARQRATFHAHEARLAHAMRVNTVGEMASGIAHELTQPLTAILSQSQAGLRLARETAISLDIVGVLEANARLAKRAGAILARLRAYISNKTPTPEPTDLNALVTHVVDLAGADLQKRDVNIALKLSDTELKVLVDRVSIEQALHNLLRNAADAVEDLPVARRTLVVETSLDDGGAIVAVRDHGPGVAPENLLRLFEPFFTTKADGMGLGLPLCQRLVESFGGRVSVAEAPGGGALFTVRLPLLSRASPDSKSSESALAPHAPTQDAAE